MIKKLEKRPVPTKGLQSYRLMGAKVPNFFPFRLVTQVDKTGYTTYNVPLASGRDVNIH
jgi:hypothetical protein